MEPNIMTLPLRKPRVTEGAEKVKLLKLSLKTEEHWYEDENANVVYSELELPNGYVVRQRDLFSLSFSSNLGRLIRAALRLPEDAVIYEIDLDEVIGKEVMGEIMHWENARGDVYERIKNFKPIVGNQLPENVMSADA